MLSLTKSTPPITGRSRSRDTSGIGNLACTRRGKAMVGDAPEEASVKMGGGLWERRRQPQAIVTAGHDFVGSNQVAFPRLPGARRQGFVQVGGKWRRRAGG